MAGLTDRNEEALYDRISEIIEAARSHVSRTVNTARVHAYWLIGREIVEVEQQGKERAEYGDKLIESLAKRLRKQFGKGFSARTLRRGASVLPDLPGGLGPSDGASQRAETVSSADRIWRRGNSVSTADQISTVSERALPGRTGLDPLPHPHARGRSRGSGILRDRSRSGELVHPGARAADRLVALRALGQEPRRRASTIEAVGRSAWASACAVQRENLHRWWQRESVPRNALGRGTPHVGDDQHDRGKETLLPSLPTRTSRDKADRSTVERGRKRPFSGRPGRLAECASWG